MLGLDLGQRNEQWGTGRRGGGLGAYLTAAEVKVQITEVTIEGEALEQCPVGGRSVGPLLPLSPLSYGFPLDAPPTLHPPDLRASRGSFVADRLMWFSV